MPKMSDSGALATVAIVISLVALFATCGQLLQQYFGTADGYRRCQQSVMGVWGTQTKLRWRWREFRFETIYYVPSISVEALRDQYMTESKQIRSGGSRAWTAEWLSDNVPNRSRKGTTPDLYKTYVISGYSTTDHWWYGPFRSDRLNQSGTSRWGGDLVCWIPLLNAVHLAQEQLNSVYSFSSIIEVLRDSGQPASRMYEAPVVPCIRIHQRSWDFMPPDIVRPLCLSTVSDIASLAIRLGMEWREFDPATGKMRAEGLGHLITSRMVRSVGIVLEYMVTDGQAHCARRKSALLRTLYLPVTGVDDLLFGVAPGNVMFNCSDRKIGTLEQINALLDSMDDDVDAEDSHLRKNLSNSMKERPGWAPGFNDIIPLMLPKMCCKATLVNTLPMPNTYHAGVFRTREGLLVFIERLEQHIAAQNGHASMVVEQVLRCVQRFRQHDQWTAKERDWGSVPAYVPGPSADLTYNSARVYQADIMDGLDLAQDFLRSMDTDANNQVDGFVYNTLLDSHLRMSITSYDIAMERINSGSAHKYSFKGRNWLVETMHVYWDKLPEVAHYVANNTGSGYQLAEEAWIVMVFRAFCWHHCHRLVPTKTILPSEWHGSKMPVYIG